MGRQTTLEELGEFGLISRITDQFRALQKPSTVLGVGDDCAVLEKDAETYTVITTDLLMEGIHFDLSFTPLKHLGFKSVTVNLSDVVAMNAIPESITVSIAVSAKFTVEAIEELYEGIRLACETYNIDLIGGDTSASLTGLAISVTAIGSVAKNEIVYRNTAQKNDLICVTGDLGASYSGLQVMQREQTVFEQTGGAQPQLDGYEYVLERYLKPEARKDIIEELRKHSILPTAMIDVSDGLSSELFHICMQSKVGCQIYEEKIPIHAETSQTVSEFEVEPIIPALNGGEDYELLFTVPLDAYDEVSKIKGVAVIGNIVEQEKSLSMISRSGDRVTLKAQGWNTFE
ncbi:MAG: thiamine-phosphate kinase [Bacteroidales bacterium]